MHAEKPKVVPPVLVEPAREERAAPLAQAGEDVGASFVRESLAALKGFHITDLNELWFQRRYSEWRVVRKNEVQIREPSDAETFLEDFWSPSSGMLLSPDFADSLERILPANTTATVFVTAKSADAVTESGQPASKATGVKFLHFKNGVAVFGVVGGSYQFQSVVP